MKTSPGISFVMCTTLTLLSCAPSALEPTPKPAQREQHESASIIGYSPTHASFPGGINALKSFLNSHLKYPRNAGCFEGNVFIQFVVNEDGSLTDFKVIKGISNIVDQGAMSTLKKMPNWAPAMENGAPVKSNVVLPVKYSLF
ncbi:energy transducer TonB [Chryseolinea lacunae]|uniref:TonB family protein n=1 Tax=Chryseolinea lacunae TaxID=2801331 RepID=A0ABS1KSX9_9BACT|nr:energy transducer TonB [Chryseolinea lacunae]MBL0742570.1 TonB family protein [Chryseolinea lacunae]